jgi:hypothetical protein
MCSAEMNKEFKYRQLVAERKKCSDCKKQGMVNPSKLPYDCYEINAWSQWQNSLSAKIMLVGQDWGDIEYFKDSKGLDAGRRKNLEGQGPTNKNLVRLFKEALDYQLDVPQKAYGRHDRDLFFTNVVLCLKPREKGRGMSSSLPKGCALHCAKKFFGRLVGIIQPQTVIALGQESFESIARSYELNLEDYSMKNNVAHHFVLDKNVTLFPVYHCSPEGRLSRSLAEQLTDWKRIRYYLNGNVDRTLDVLSGR